MATFDIMVRMAREFQTLAGQPNHLLRWEDSHTNLLKSRRNWIIEEIDEYYDADEKNDRTEKLDALVDICYFAAGHYATFKNILAQNGVRVPGFSWVTSAPVLEVPSEVEPGIQGLLKFTKQVEDLIQIVHYLAQRDSLPLARGYELVHENNLTKIPTTLQEAELTVEKYIRENIPVQIYPFELNGKTFYPVRIADGAPMAGKLMKAINYVPVNLAPAFISSKTWTQVGSE